MVKEVLNGQDVQLGVLTSLVNGYSEVSGRSSLDKNFQVVGVQNEILRLLIKKV